VSRVVNAASPFPQPVRVEVAVPLPQVLDRRQQPAITNEREAGAHDLEAAGTARLVAFGPPRDDSRVEVVELRARHAQRRKDPLGREITQRLPARALHDLRQQQIAGVGVRVAHPRLEVERVLPGDHLEGHLLRDLVGDAAPRQRPQPEIVANTAGVVHQVIDRDRLRVRRQFRDPLPHRIGERDRPVLGQQRDARGRELLGRRRDVEDRARPDRHPLIEVGHPVAAPEDDAVIAIDADGAAGSVGVIVAGEDRVDRRR
jgi:hypothetical protein